VAGGTQLVQFGSILSDSLLELTPDSADTIGSILGVYLTTDPTLAGTNYYAVTGTFEDGKVQLAQALPSGTKTAYIKYVVKTGVTQPPVYVKYFNTTNQASFKAGDTVTFRVNYKDPDGDSPNYHDSVQGYVKLVFNDISESRKLKLLTPIAPGTTVNYKSNVLFTTDPMSLPEGTHKYHYEASDGYYIYTPPNTNLSCRWPQVTGLGDPTANDYTIKVNYRPVILAGRVSPANGKVGTPFVFAATYQDKDGTTASPPKESVYVRISKEGASWERSRL